MSAEELRFDKAKWTQGLGPICQMWVSLYQKDTFERLQITREQEEAPDPVIAFVFMEIVMVKEILHSVNESVTTLTKVL